MNVFHLMLQSSLSSPLDLRRSKVGSLIFFIPVLVCTFSLYLPSKKNNLLIGCKCEMVLKKETHLFTGREYQKNDPAVTVDYNTADPVVRWDSYENFNQRYQDSLEGNATVALKSQHSLILKGKYNLKRDSHVCVCFFFFFIKQV